MTPVTLHSLRTPAAARVRNHALFRNTFTRYVNAAVLSNKQRALVPNSIWACLASGLLGDDEPVVLVLEPRDRLLLSVMLLKD